MHHSILDPAGATRAAARRGHTLLELAIVLAVVAVLVAAGYPHVRRIEDAAQVRAATTEAVATLAVARQAAIARGVGSTLRVDTAAARLVVVAAADTVVVRDLGRAYRVRVGATRLELRWSPSGVGFGASNARLAIGRGRSADTVIVSRLGRVRH